MEFNEYKNLSIRTLPDLGSQNLNLAHMLMGIVSELNELEDAIENNDTVNILEECVDMIWYLSGHSYLRNHNSIMVVSLNYIEDEPSIISNGVFFLRTTFGLKPRKQLNLLYKSVSTFSDIIKKHIAYNKDIDELEELLLVGNIHYHISEIIKFYHLDVKVGLNNNINKLKVRFPNKFSEENAKNRDLVRERIELEKK